MILLALLCCPGSGEEAFEVHMWPEKLALEPGGSLEINCSTSCAQPEAGGLETTLSKELRAQEPQWKLYSVSNASEDTVVFCYFTCAGQQQSTSANVSVFYPPKQVLLRLQPSWVAVGSTFILECRVPAVAPLERLTLTLLRDQQTLHSQTFERASADPQEAVVTHNATAGREDGRHSFSCRAELDLRALGGDLVSSVSEPQVLDVYELTQDNQMVIIIAAVSVLLFLFVMSVLLCFAFGQHWRQRRTGAYRVQAAWQSLRWPSRS